MTGLRDSLLRHGSFERRTYIYEWFRRLDRYVLDWHSAFRDCRHDFETFWHPSFFVGRASPHGTL